jgi:3-hydroxyisobutyrate dehydrogenase-like beta-hydroxyacid dehydrogenase
VKLAFLGLGQMGMPMASRLVDAGHRVQVWNRTAARAEPLAARGARVAASPAEAVRGVEAAFTMLADPRALSTVVEGPGGLRAGLASGTTWFEMSTVGPEAIQKVAAQIPPGVVLMDAPVLGSVPQATDGTLKIFVGGDAAEFERWQAVLEVFGRPLHVGPLGSGAATKLVANSTLGALMTALGEALALADALGLDPHRTLDILADSPIGVPVRSKREHLESGAYPPRFKLALAAKDLHLVTAAAIRARCEMPLAEAAGGWFEAAAREGLGALDYSAVIAHIRGLPARLGEDGKSA